MAIYHGVAFIDIDGIIADCEHRIELAKQAKQAYVENYEDRALIDRVGVDNVYWTTFFNPTLVAQDSIIDGALQHVEALELAGFKILFLTSRPESLRRVTWGWLSKHNFKNHEVIMKNASFQRLYTTKWKSGIIQTLAPILKAVEVIHVDDSHANQKMLHDEWCHGESIILRQYTSLVEAVANEQG